MKNTFYLSFCFCVAVLFAGSCQKNPVAPATVQKPVTASSEAKTAGRHDGVMISCAGSCDCGLVGSGKNVSCSCADCKMKLRFSSNGVFVREAELEDATYEVPMLRYYLAYAKKKGGKILLRSVEITTTDELEIVLFTFDAGGVSESVMYSNSLVKDEKYEIDCTGDCGCKEEYNFGSNTAACSCTDCRMSVTKLTY